jgi:hypothetical protein
VFPGELVDFLAGVPAISRRGCPPSSRERLGFFLRGEMADIENHVVKISVVVTVIEPELLEFASRLPDEQPVPTEIPGGEPGHGLCSMPAN